MYVTDYKSQNEGQKSALSVLMEFKENTCFSVHNEFISLK